MSKDTVINFIDEVLVNMPADWLNLTTHRLDIYDEGLAKTEFLDRFQDLFSLKETSTSAFGELPTAYDYIRLGHPLSCVLEWGLAQFNDLKPENVITFSSRTAPFLAILRKNLLEGRATRISFIDELPNYLNFEVLRAVYGYQFELNRVDKVEDISSFSGSSIFISVSDDFNDFHLQGNIDFSIRFHSNFGSTLLVGLDNDEYISEIQHVRRRETIAMTPANCHLALQQLTGKVITIEERSVVEKNKVDVVRSVHDITATKTKVAVGSSGLSIQYAIMMGLIDHAMENHKGKDIKFIVPPNCYGGTNDQARRVAACLDHVEVLDLPVDGDHNMVESVDRVLERVASEDAIPYIIAEIPTNPRVEVPDLVLLKDVLGKTRKTQGGKTAIDPVFILDQTFCPNVQFLSSTGLLSQVRTISYVSGSKFPSGGKCTAGYCVSNDAGKALIDKIEQHLYLCDNQATDLQLEILSKQLPTMIKRIAGAYKNTREFVEFIQSVLPAAKINFVSEELVDDGFTPSVFSLDLPTKGSTEEERETYKRALNNKLINLMITEIPAESKYCVSYGQLTGCYWTIPATSTQGTTKEGDKDYIARVALSPDMDLERHKEVFLQFVSGMSH